MASSALASGGGVSAAATGSGAAGCSGSGVCPSRETKPNVTSARALAPAIRRRALRDNVILILSVVGGVPAETVRQHD